MGTKNLHSNNIPDDVDSVGAWITIWVAPVKQNTLDIFWQAKDLSFHFQLFYQPQQTALLPKGKTIKEGKHNLQSSLSLWS